MKTIEQVAAENSSLVEEIEGLRVGLSNLIGRANTTAFWMDIEADNIRRYDHATATNLKNRANDLLDCAAQAKSLLARGAN